MLGNTRKGGRQCRMLGTARSQEGKGESNGHFNFERLAKGGNRGCWGTARRQQGSDESIALLVKGAPDVGAQKKRSASKRPGRWKGHLAITFFCKSEKQIQNVGERQRSQGVSTINCTSSASRRGNQGCLPGRFFIYASQKVRSIGASPSLPGFLPVHISPCSPTSAMPLHEKCDGLTASFLASCCSQASSISPLVERMKCN